jgi:hypothetical protein
LLLLQPLLLLLLQRLLLQLMVALRKNIRTHRLRWRLELR